MIFKEKNGQNIFGEEYYLSIQDGRPHHTAVDILCKTGEHVWTADHLCMNQIRRQNWICIKMKEPIKLNIVQNLSLVMVWRD